jgi:uncharacterized coiled-coil protein SlyX
MTQQVHDISAPSTDQERIIALLSQQVAEMKRQNSALEQNNRLLKDLLTAQQRNNSPWMTQEEAAVELGIATKRKKHFVRVLNHLHEIGRLPTVQGVNNRQFSRQEVKELSRKIQEGRVVIPTYTQLIK